VRIVRGRAEARWLPSRHRFGLFRLWAYARLRSAKPEPRPGLMLIVDPDQSAVECYTTSTWIALTTAGYIAAELAKRWPLPLAIAAAIPLACIALHLPLLVGAAIVPVIQALARRRVAWYAAINSTAIAAVHILIAAFLAKEQTWVRFVAWQALVVFGLNAIAAAIVLLLRGRIATLEASYGVTPSSAS
jgi:hypothetical protein